MDYGRLTELRKRIIDTSIVKHLGHRDVGKGFFRCVFNCKTRPLNLPFLMKLNWPERARELNIQGSVVLYRSSNSMGSSRRHIDTCGQLLFWSVGSRVFLIFWISGLMSAFTFWCQVFFPDLSPFLHFAGEKVFVVEFENPDVGCARCAQERVWFCNGFVGFPRYLNQN